VTSDLDDPRVTVLLEILERMAAGELDETIPISPRHDGLDAIAFGINALVGELRFSADHLRRAKEAAEHADQAKTAFVRNISHEIRTPITAILGAAQLLGDGKVATTQRLDLLARIRTNAQALLDLVDELLDLSKVVAGKLELEAAPMDPREVISDVVRSLAPQAEAKALRVILDGGDGVPAIIASDRRRVRQILMNVVGNAIKFTQSGTIAIRLARAGDRLTIDVTDTGIGLTDGQRARLFVPFEQADPMIARTYGGTGLGLALSQRLAEGLGGGLELTASTPGAGTTFRITLAIPHEPAAEPARAPDGRAAFGARSLDELAGLAVLLVEDNADIRMAVYDLLELGGARVDQAAGGREAIDKVLAGRFDVVLMDVRMPDLDGLEATRTLRRRGCTLPIVALTADAVAEHRAECLAAGYDDYLVKPIDWGRLIEIVLKVCRARA
jgi:signal transduction histidine kinase/CheY-like chemotaxis protein